MADLPDPLLEQFLATNDPACPVCKYELGGLKSDRCPECNAPITLRLEVRGHPFDLWIVNLISIATLSGPFYFVVSLTILALFDNKHGVYWPDEWVWIVGAASGISLTVHLLANRMRWQWWHNQIRWAIFLGGTGWLIMLIFIAWLV